MLYCSGQTYKKIGENANSVSSSAIQVSENIKIFHTFYANRQVIDTVEGTG